MTPTTVRLYGKAEEQRWSGFASVLFILFE
jgi:hypothetical protein